MASYNRVLCRCCYGSFITSAAATASVIPARPRSIGRFKLLKPNTSNFFISLSTNCSTFTSPYTTTTNDAEFVVSRDDKYGNKQIISLTSRLYDYILSNVREPQILRELREETASMRGSQMQVSPDQAQLLAMLVQILGAQRCIEVGVYTGYSSLAVALVLPESGCLVACERDARSLEVAKRYYERAGVSHKVNVKHGLAADILETLILNGEAGSYDFAFVDAEKRMNQEYFELLIQLVRVGGVIVVDNVLWHGKVSDPLVKDAKTVSIRNFNKNLMDDKRISVSMVGVSSNSLMLPNIFVPSRSATAGIIGAHWGWHYNLPKEIASWFLTELNSVAYCTLSIVCPPIGNLEDAHVPHLDKCKMRLSFVDHPVHWFSPGLKLV